MIGPPRASSKPIVKRSVTRASSKAALCKDLERTRKPTTSTMAVPSDVPFQIEEFHVLPIALPTVPSFPLQTFHYLYFKPHEPKCPHPTSSRSLFLVNIPFDSTEPHLKHLFSAQLGLPTGRIQRVEFEAEETDPLGIAKARAAAAPDAPAAPLSGKAAKKKRKHADELEQELPEVVDEWPPLWDRKLHRGGATAVIEFVDRPSMRAALKAAKRACRARPPTIKWEEGLEADIPPLGADRTSRARSVPHRSVTTSLTG